jgi:integrase
MHTENAILHTESTTGEETTMGRAQAPWSGPVEKYIRKVVVNGRRVYRLQMGSAGKKGRSSQIFGEHELDRALAVKRVWVTGGVPAAGARRAAAAVEAAPATVEDGLDHYALVLREAGQDYYRVAQLVPMLARELPELLAKPIDLVSVDDFAAFRRVREQPRLKRTGQTAAIKPNTIRRDMGILRAMVKKARPGFEVPAECFPAAEERVRFLNPGEVVQVDTALEVDEGPTLRRLGQLMMENISRQHDWRLLRRPSVHLTEGRVEFPESKGTVRSLNALSARSRQLLKEQLASHDSEWVFVNPGTGLPYSRVHVSRVLRRALRAAGRHDFTAHDLKHHAASAFVAHGATDRELQAAGGWKTSGMLAKYAHVRSERLRELNERVSGGVTPSSPRPVAGGARRGPGASSAARRR